MRRTIGIALAAVITAACSGGSPTAVPSIATAPPSTPSPTRASHDMVTDVQVDGQKFHVVCVGPTDSGRPTVVFENGLGGDLKTWSAVLVELQATDRACAYDRLGEGDSDAPPATRTTTTQVAEVRAVLAKIDVTPPFVLVGYSIGGWNVAVHNDADPAGVVGAVMVDVRPPNVSARWLAALPPQASDEPEGVRLNREDLTIFEADPTLNPERIDLRASAAETLAASGFGDKPVIVLAAADSTAISEGLPDDLAAQFVSIWWEEQQSLSDLSTNGRLERVADATHDMPFERADAIVAAIREVLGK